VKSDKDKEKKSLSLKDIGLPRIIALILASVVLLICFVPSGSSLNSKKTTRNTTSIAEQTGSDSKDETIQYLNRMERKLQVMLKKVKGIGQVEVMITAKASKEQVTLKDSPFSQESSSETDSQGGTRNSSNVQREEETVLMQSGSGGTSPYVVKEIEPDIEGVLVIAQGGEDPKIIQEINSAVQVLFDVPAHKIKVMKMI